MLLSSRYAADLLALALHLDGSDEDGELTINNHAKQYKKSKATEDKIESLKIAEKRFSGWQPPNRAPN